MRSAGTTKFCATLPSRHQSASGPTNNERGPQGNRPPNLRAYPFRPSKDHSLCGAGLRACHVAPASVPSLRAQRGNPAQRVIASAAWQSSPKVVSRPPRTTFSASLHVFFLDCHAPWNGARNDGLRPCGSKLNRKTFGNRYNTCQALANKRMPANRRRSL